MAYVPKSKLQLAIVVYWILLVYIIFALLWWALSLAKQNETIYQLRKEHLNVASSNHTSNLYLRESDKIENLRKRQIIKYISEGGVFLLLILFGAVFIYRSVRRQFFLQQQQQNFVMAVTHELKTPISVSRLNLETLQRHNLDEIKKAKLLQMTLKETYRLDTLINNILISSQLDGHSYHLAREELNFSDLTGDVVTQFNSRYADRSLITQIEKELDLFGDPLLLKLLVSNLLENAYKYSGKDSVIRLNLYAGHEKIILEVIDEGPGIEENEKANIFRKFYRIGNEQTRKAMGTGLGLYLCKKIAEDHKARISIKSNTPQGSNFTVTFNN